MDNNKTFTILMMNIICFLSSASCLLLGVLLIPKLTTYYVVLLIPMLILFLILTVSLNIKIVLSIIELIFGQNDNDEVTDKLNSYRRNINNIVEYSLMILFAILLVIIMILDILLCIKKKKYILLGVSILIWLALIYSLLKVLLRKE